jgi:hypothetical protein
MLVTDHRIWVQRIAVAVQTGDLYAGALELSEELVPRCVGGKDVVKGGNVYRR